LAKIVTTKERKKKKNSSSLSLKRNSTEGEGGKYGFILLC